MSELSSQFAAELMTEVAERFCALPEPTSAVETSLHQSLQVTVGGILGALAHADSMARLTPTAEGEVRTEMKSFAERDFALQSAIDSVRFGSKIGAICSRHQILGR